MSAAVAIAARALNDLSFCPRMFALEHGMGEFHADANVIDGRTVHRRVDAPTRRGLSPAPDRDDPAQCGEDGAAGDAPPPRPVRQVLLSDDALGLIARCDIVEEHADGRVVPIDYKKGVAPDHPDGAWEPERVQVAAQAMLLRAHGYHCDTGAVWFAGSRVRVPVAITPALEERVLALRNEARRILAAPAGTLPPPLIDSPKCRGCALVGICLPDEVNGLAGRSSPQDDPRPLFPARDDGVPLHVVLQGGSLGKDGDEIVVRDKGSVVARARVADTSAVIVHGNASLSTALLAHLAAEGIPVGLHSTGGWYQGSFHPPGGPGGPARAAQHAAASDPARSLTIARVLIADKIRNCRVLLRRNGAPSSRVLDELAALAASAGTAGDPAALLGVEGLAARIYFAAFSGMVKADAGLAFQMEGRNRRPPLDPINAMLSFAYACLTREWATAITRVGLDPARGLLHQQRPGKPALALDLMEPFRPIVADSAVLTAINTGAVGPDDFLHHPTGVALTDAGRRRFLLAWERRLDELATHPATGTRVSMRRMFELHVRLFARHLLGELAAPPEYRVR